MSNKNEADDDSRKQLLDALDSEIGSAQATLSWTGRSRWALTLSLSALLWLGIQIWGQGKFSGHNVALLALAFSVFWEFILQIRSTLNSSFLPGQSLQGKFFSFSYLLGTLRFTIVFAALSNAVALAALLWLNLRGLLFVTICYAVNLISVIIVLVVSYVDLPPLSPSAIKKRYGGLLLLNTLLTWSVRIAIVTLLGAAIWKMRPTIEADDLRLGLIIAALVYLLNLLVDEQVSTSHLTALRSVRQNLAFSRISNDEARNQADLLLFEGKNGAQSVQQRIDAILARADQVRSRYAQIESLLPNYNEIIRDVAEPKFEGEILHAKAAESDKLGSFLLKLFAQAKEQHQELRSRVQKLESHIKAIAFFSPSAAREIQPLTEKVKLALAPLDERQKQMHEALIPCALTRSA